MNSGRLEAFSDGVLAILITIMVLELRPPEGATLSALKPLVPTIATYVLSFVFIAIYWNNHHHLMRVVERVDGGVLWANMHLLFWLSLIPFVSAWMGRHARERVPVAVYGVVLLGAAVAYFVLAHRLRVLHEPGSALTKALGDDRKGKISAVAYLLALVAVAVSTWLAIGIYVAVALTWLVPDRRITRVVGPNAE